MREIKFRAWLKSENLMGEVTGLVVFKSCGFKVEIPNVGNDELVDWERYFDSIEVIGNIYENPELLKEND